MKQHRVRLLVTVAMLLSAALISLKPAAAVSWYSRSSFSAGTQNLGAGNSGGLSIAFDVTPAAKPIDGVIGYADSSTSVSGYSSLAAIVRMNRADGVFDARNGGDYSRLTSLPYEIGKTYRVQILADLPARRYSVYVTPPGGSPVLIARDFAFRSDAPPTDDFGKITLHSDTNNEFSIANHHMGDDDSQPSPTPGSVPTPTPLPTPDSGQDKFGIRMIYPTKSGGEQWFMDMGNPENDPRFNPKDDISRNSDGSWRMTDGQVRMNVRTSTYRWGDDDVVWRQSDLETRGYMYDPNDWKNVEMTGYIKLNAGSDDEFSWYARGHRHTGNDDAPEACWGTAYKGRLHYDNGNTGWGKEIWHSDGYASNQDKGAKNVINSSIRDRWIGFKVIMYNISGGVRLEIWIDKDANNQWAQAATYEDKGGWATNNNPCNGSDDQIITWGGPIATFRWDNASSVDFKWLSVREIQR